MNSTNQFVRTMAAIISFTVTISQACGASDHECATSRSLSRDVINGNVLLQVAKRKFEEVSPKKLLYVGVLSSPKNKERRDFVRTAYMNDLRKKYNDSGITAEFIIGHTPYTRSEQGTRGTSEQLDLEESIADEAALNSDIRRIVFPEKYENLPDKVFHLFHYSAEQQYDFLMKLDDDMILDIDAIERFLATQNASDFLYAGTYFWGSKSYKSQEGPDQDFVPYFAGPCYLLSCKLVRQIVDMHGAHAAEFIRYGSSSEDVDVGRWVQWEASLGNNVTYTTLPSDVLAYKPKDPK
jgi:hypothetical protein